MRIYLVTVFCLLAATAAARPDWLSMSSGLRLGFGPEQAGGSEQYRNPADSFADLYTFFDPYPLSHQTTLAGNLGAWFAAGWQRRVELQVEFNYGSDEFKTQEDYKGLGVTRVLNYERVFYEMPVLLKLGWPITMKKGSLRPFADVGVFTNQTVNTPRKSISTDGGAAAVSDWKPSPMEDHGYLYGLGLDYSFGRFIIGAEARYREGLNDLDPSGRFEQKARSLNFNLSAGWTL